MSEIKLAVLTHEIYWMLIGRREGLKKQAESQLNCKIRDAMGTSTVLPVIFGVESQVYATLRRLSLD